VVRTDSRRVSLAPRYLGYPWAASNFRAPGYHGLWPNFPDRYASPPPALLRSRYPRETSSPGLGSSAFARHYSRNHCRFLLLGLLRCFTSPRVASPDYEFIRRYPEINRGGLSHSEIHGSTPVCGFPWLIATCYVLHRLLAPRHPPIALSSLITKLTSGVSPESTQRNVNALFCMWLSKNKTARNTRTPAPLHAPVKNQAVCRDGGPDWTRTSDPALIKRML
jgi:hypothetical protein